MTVTFSAYIPGSVGGVCSPAQLDINMNIRNAVMVCEALGIDLNDVGWCGSMTAADFQGRVLMALAVAPVDEGMPAYEHPGPGATMIEGARIPGYLQERLGQLRELADWAVANNAEISFG